jgi:hypothetical protein
MDGAQRYQIDLALCSSGDRLEFHLGIANPDAIVDAVTSET